ncbi:hypothetical protein [Bacillus massilinigeriensis]|uniref:hypothetical protein n=1 Tax=Bacillus mediterraneensis TaxID=1805474 RepID=UPI0008F7F7E1|nr:hypothetical protein [Bacillus mediterraneensis]
MRWVILVLLLMMLGLVSWLAISLGKAEKASSSTREKYIKVEFTVTEVRANRYYAKSRNGKGIVIKKEHLEEGVRLKVDDTVIAFFQIVAV